MILAAAQPTETWYLVLGALLFTIGGVGVMVRRNPLVMFMCVELMLNSANLSFVAFARYLNALEGQLFVFFVLTIAAAEVVVGLAIIVSIYRSRANIDVDEMNSLKG